MDLINEQKLADAIKPLEDKALDSFHTEIQSLINWANTILDTYKVTVTFEKKDASGK